MPARNTQALWSKLIKTNNMHLSQAATIWIWSKSSENFRKAIVNKTQRRKVQFCGVGVAYHQPPSGDRPDRQALHSPRRPPQGRASGDREDRGPPRIPRSCCSRRRKHVCCCDSQRLQKQDLWKKTIMISKIRITETNNNQKSKIGRITVTCDTIADEHGYIALIKKIVLALILKMNAIYIGQLWPKNATIWSLWLRPGNTSYRNQFLRT